MNPSDVVAAAVQELDSRQSAQYSVTGKTYEEACELRDRLQVLNNTVVEMLDRQNALVARLMPKDAPMPVSSAASGIYPSGPLR